MPQKSSTIEKERIILGIDPGSLIMGFGVIEGSRKNPEYIDMGMIDFRKDGDHYDRLKSIFNATTRLIENYSPTEVALEAPFFGKNVQSMLKLGRAQGMAMAAALSKDLPIFEYAPRRIKVAITGVGQASKEQVAIMLKKMFTIENMTSNLDATDGLAAALCHFYETGSPIKIGKSKGWEDFIRSNPDRVK